MAGATLSTLSALLKDYYLPPVREQLNNETFILSVLDVNNENLYGNQAVVPLHYGRSGGLGARAEGGALPLAGNQSYQRAVYDLKYLYGRVKVTGPSMAKTSSEAGAFLQALKSELEAIRNDLKKDVARQLYGDGTASIAVCGTTTSSLTVVLGSAEAIKKGQLYVGQVVDIGTAAAPTTIVANAVIAGVSASGPSITLSSTDVNGNTVNPVTTSNSHSVSRAGSRGASSAVYEINAGLQALIPTAANSIGGIDASQAANSYWDNQRQTSVGDLTVDAMLQMWNTIRIAGGEPEYMITSYGLQRAFFKLLQSQVRYTSPMQIAGGFSSLEFMGKSITADLEAPWSKIHFFDKQSIEVFSNRDWHFLDEDGNILKWSVGFDAWEAVLARYMNLGACRRNTLGVMSGVTIPTGQADNGV